MKNIERLMLIAFVVTVLVHGGANRAYSQSLASLETEDVRLLYFDPIQTYLAPHVARCFQNSLASHQSTLGFDPAEKATIFLRDFSEK